MKILPVPIFVRFPKISAWRPLAVGLVCLGFSDHGFAQAASPAPAKSFIDYFLPTPLAGALSKEVWGAAAVGPRDPGNGLEDATMQHWNYWDGQIIKAKDGKYHLFACRWDQADGSAPRPSIPSAARATMGTAARLS